VHSRELLRVRGWQLGDGDRCVGPSTLAVHVVSLSGTRAPSTTSGALLCRPLCERRRRSGRAAARGARPLSPPRGPSRLFLISSRVEWVEGNGIFAEGGVEVGVWRAREKACGLRHEAGPADVAGGEENVYLV
jgi:hypothetical protein